MRFHVHLDCFIRHRVNVVLDSRYPEQDKLPRFSSLSLDGLEAQLGFANRARGIHFRVASPRKDLACCLPQRESAMFLGWYGDANLKQLPKDALRLANPQGHNQIILVFQIPLKQPKPSSHPS